MGREPVVESAGKPQLVPAQEDGDVAGRTSHTTVLYVIAPDRDDDRAYRVGACERRVQE